ncbi:AraC family transcriptional regulator [Breoghania corrubedonensis]|uniref:AraC family transcriptional regulator n=1 Tax=Breoghania corrubedonensis TaxID=665038 RepID=A0A2T5V4W1_9HYPH|nr:AraC family transcriptional regulator [Breoghania corrubedonensis]PTW58760.1 AraC family transcriptional regulator [Breoghania corrubedonensis]
MQRNRYHHLGWHHGIEVFEASFSTQTFNRHSHEGFAIGAIADGAGGYDCRGESVILPAGSLSLLNPEEPHTGRAVADRVRYNMVYATEDAVRASLGLRRLTGFREVAPRDRDLRVTYYLQLLADRLNAAQGPGWRLAVEEAVHEVLARTFACYAGVPLRRPGHEPGMIRALRERIASGVTAGERLSLRDLAAERGFSPSYLIRSFARATGMTPHGYVVQCRIQLARDLMLDNVPAAEAALAAGFCDQAHMIRQFRRHYGVSPGVLIRH